MVKRLRLFFPLLIFFALGRSITAFAQDVQPISSNPYRNVFAEIDDFDSTYLQQLEMLLVNRPIDTTYFAILNDLAYYSHTRNLLKAYNFTKQGLVLTNEANNSLWNGRFKLTQGAILLRMEKLDSAEQVLTEAKLYVTKEDLPFLTTQLGYVYERRGELDKAVDYALESMRLGQALNDIKAEALAYSDLSNLFWKQSKFKVGLEYGLKSVNLFKKVGMNSLDYNFTLFVVGNNLLGLKRYKDAQWYYQQCITMAEQYGFYNNLSDVYIFESELDIRLGDYLSAVEEGKKAIKYAILLDNNFMLMRSWLIVGQAELGRKKFAEAVLAIQKCIQIAGANFGDEYYLNQAYRALGEANSGLGYYKQAYQAFTTYDSLKENIFTTEADQRIALLQTQFNTAQQQAKINKQEAEIAQQQNRQLLILVITAFLVLVILILIFFYASNKRKNKLLEKQNKEKEFLLKEIHHRVKNNLGVVSSLLALQSEQIDDASIKDAMVESQNRVNSMSMIHQKLYQGTNLALIELKDYFINLSSHILDSFGKDEQVKIQVEMKTRELDVDTAVPLGLIVNELLTNAMKYAFEEDTTNGLILISCQERENQLFITIRDNGSGFDASNSVQGTGFGTQLIQLLVTQLGGDIRYSNGEGTTVELQFSLGA